MNSDELIRAGYRKCEERLMVNDFKYFYQKAIYNESNERLFFINVSEFDYSDLHAKGHLSNFPRFNYQPVVHFETEEDECIVVKMIINPNTTIEQMEKFYKNMFVKMNFKNYDS